MNLKSRCFPLAALAAALLITAAGCKSSTQTATDPNAQNPDQATSASTGTAAAPGGQADSTGSKALAGGSSTRSGKPAPASPAAIDLPAGTLLRVRLDDDLGSKISQPGEAFTATVSDDVVVNGQTVIAKGSRADGTVVDAQPLGKIKGGARLQVRLDRVHTNWGSYPVETSSISRAENGKGKRTLMMGGGGAALGALIGGLTGGGKGAAIGAAAGAGAGTAGSAFTGNKQIVLPAETLLSFKLEQPVQISQTR
jgi:hypothetical protein